MTMLKKWMLLAALGLLAFPAQAADDIRFQKAFPGAPFSEAVEVDGILYLSGQLGNDAALKLPDGMEAQARQVMENIKAAVERRGLTMDRVFKCTVMMQDMKQWGDFNKIYITYFKPDRLPARSAFGSSGLALGALLEVECWAKM
ncbi:RidA family protein [Niveispirillum sp.]|uniref:RidA family protein n=1 Tax=Niveispirillum sp. TaxID=1917217 RepID=UPI001B3DC22A|nr:RidA family protein [Niveispirillum sp.]MBP7340272.1 RidA family protein [Niveispirillum sp.]